MNAKHFSAALATGLAVLAMSAPSASAQATTGSLDFGSLQSVTDSLQNIGGSLPDTTVQNDGGFHPVADPVPAPQPQITAASIEQDLRNKIDAVRAANGVGPVIWDTNVANGARLWSAKLATENAFYHSTMVNGEGENIYHSGIPYEVYGPQFTVDAWMKSPGHRAFLLSRSTKRAGVGVAQNQDGSWSVTYRGFND